MKGVVRRWGSSLAVRLPQAIASDLKLEDGTRVALTVRDNALTMTPLGKRYRLEDLLAGMSDDKKHREADWGKPEGKES